MSAHIVFCGHGSKDPRWRRPFDRLLALAQSRGAAGPKGTASVGFLQFIEPSLSTVLESLCESGERRIIVLPVFIAGGSHVERDIPEIVANVGARFPGVQITVLPCMGETDEILAVVLETALKAAQ